MRAPDAPPDVPDVVADQTPVASPLDEDLNFEPVSIADPDDFDPTAEDTGEDVDDD